MKKTLMVASVLLLAASFSQAQIGPPATSTLSVTVGAEASITAQAGPLTSTGTFGNYTGTTLLNYKVRTIAGGHITVLITTDFSPGGTGGGPSVAHPPTSGDALTYSCSASNPVTGSATPCSSTQTASTTTDTPVVDFAATTQSASAGTAASTSWTLTNDPSYAAGTYNAVATFTISAT
jgi:hypothetical protein